MDDNDHQTAINDHGDVLIPTTGQHGGDISSQRIDDLDQACLDFLEGVGTASKAVDIGGGLGGQSKRMAERGADVFMVDLTDQSENIAAFNARLGRIAIRVTQSDARDFDIASLGPLNVIYSQRMLSCIPHGDAKNLMQKIYEASCSGSHGFISAGGLFTEVGRSYPGHGVPIDRRWAIPNQHMAAKHQMFAPECLYSEEELAELLRSCGFSIVRRWTSPFGNPKVICRRD